MVDYHDRIGFIAALKQVDETRAIDGNPRYHPELPSRVRRLCH